MSNVFSTPEQLKQIRNILTGYLKLPFSGESIPGALMENVIGDVRGGDVLNTYDFVDVINQGQRVGWQVKSTKASTPVTWKRAKIPNSQNLIAASRQRAEGLQALGNAIIDFCNHHAQESMTLYDLDEIGYARLIVHKDASLTYYERLLCSRAYPCIFNRDEYSWSWSTPKVTTKKEQLPALHGVHIPTGEKWFAWHGLGENQLHFSGEKAWWPKTGENSIDFGFPANRLTQAELMNVLSGITTNS